MNAKTIKQYIVLNSLSSLGKSAIFSTYVTFLIEHGLNLLEVNMVNVVFFTALLIFEIPTGFFADICGRKLSYVIACLLVSIAGLIYISSYNFVGFAIAECIFGIGSTFANGAFDAWLVDNLKYGNYQGDMIKIFKKAGICSQIFGIVGLIIGAYLATIDSRLPWYFVSIVLFATLIIAQLWLKEDYFIKKEFSFKSHFIAMKDTVSHSIEFGIKNKIIRFLLLIGIIQAFAMQAPNMQWQPYFIKYLVQKQYLGYLSSCMVLAILAGTILVTIFINFVKDDKKAITICQVITGLMIMVVVLLPYPLNMCMFVLHEIPRGIFGPLKKKFLQENIPSQARATISSFEAVYPHLGGIIGLTLSGVVANKYGIGNTWIMAGGLLIAFTTIVYKLSFKK